MAVPPNLPATHKDFVNENITAAMLNDIATAVNHGLAYNVKDQAGVVGDGVHDDTLGVQAAIDAAHAAGGGMVLFPPGTYVCTLLTIYGGIDYVGTNFTKSIIKLKDSTGTSLFQTANFGTLTGTQTLGGEIGFHIKNLTFDGNQPNQSVAAPLLRFFGYGYRMTDNVIYNSRRWLVGEVGGGRLRAELSWHSEHGSLPNALPLHWKFWQRRQLAWSTRQPFRRVRHSVAEHRSLGHGERQFGFLCQRRQ